MEGRSSDEYVSAFVPGSIRFDSYVADRAVAGHDGLTANVVCASFAPMAARASIDYDLEMLQPGERPQQAAYHLVLVYRGAREPVSPGVF